METVKIIENVIASNLSVTTSIKSATLISGTTYVLNVCKNLWFIKGKTVIVNEVNGTIESFTNTDVTIKFDATPLVFDTIAIDKPTYYYGTVIKVIQEIANNDLNGYVNERTPFIYVKESFDETYNLNDSIIDRTSNLRIFFLTESNFADWKTTEHYAEAIEPLRYLVNAFLDALNKSKLIGKLTDYTTTNHANFGVYVTDKGHTQSIFNDQLSGIELTISLPILKNQNCNCN